MHDLFAVYGHLGTSDEFRRKAVFAVSVSVIAIAVVALVWIGRHVLLLLFAGCIGALILSTLTDWVKSKLRLQRGLAFALVVVSLFALFGLGIWFRGPVLAHHIVDLQSDIPSALGRIRSRLELQDWGHWLISQITASDQISRGLAFVASGIGGAMVVTGATIAGLFLVIISSLYLGAEPATYLRGVEALLTLPTRNLVNACLREASRTLKTWLLAKAVSMTTIGTIVCLGLLMLQVPLAGTLGVIAGLLTFIPNLGPILSALPAALLAFGVSPVKGLLTILLFCLAHFLEGNLVTPLAERRIVRLPPALTLTVQLLLGSVTGALGVALAAPFTAFLLAVAGVLLRSKENENEPLTASRLELSRP